MSRDDLRHDPTAEFAHSQALPEPRLNSSGPAAA
jgi:hypothetical protein